VPSYLTEPLPALVEAPDDDPETILRVYAINAEGFAQCYARYPALVRALKGRGLTVRGGENGP
jgi:hypothetical protein